ncbi:OLC1v1000762C1 [Oldenlandia corymbosa var. corymbosa]|uniref:OLC1v1000762C1 n=1 Tax=Oldenlandia corymbosa var. corymbosa TaxID=529605 RepID=A0AAV1D6P0_OLDCO|nr:OLC1v1000762C1 [Oldenlandia corymbosa var. corymbosa]
MAAKRPPDEKNLSFSEILKGAKPNPRKMFKSTENPNGEESFIHSSPTVYKGEPAFLLTKEEDDKLAEPFKNALIGKFSKGRPSMEYLWAQFQKIGFKGEFSLGMLDHRLVLICFDQEDDFQRIKGLWMFDNHIMRVLKWTPEFNPEHESSISPVWVAFEGLPIHRFNAEFAQTGWNYRDAIEDPCSNLEHVKAINCKALLKTATAEDPGNKASTSGVAAAEKGRIPIDVADVNLSSRFEVLAAMAEDQHNETDRGAAVITENELQRVEVSDSELEELQEQVATQFAANLEYEQDDIEVGKQTEGHNLPLLRVVESDEEGQKKRPGRPKGSVKNKKLQGGETQKSSRINGDLPLTVNKE